MFGKTLFEKLRKKVQLGPRISHNVVPFTDVGSSETEEDGFLIIGRTEKERTTTDSLEHSLDQPPSYESQIDLPSYKDLYSSEKMGGRHSKKEIFEPTLHTASRQVSTEAAPANTHNDVLTPYFQALQRENSVTDSPPEEPVAETDILCSTAPPLSEEPPIKSTSSAQAPPPPATPYDDIPFKLSLALVAGQSAADAGRISNELRDLQHTSLQRYNYDFKLERGVVRDSKN